MMNLLHLDGIKNAFSKYSNGEPDVVFFVHDAEYFGGATDVPVVY